MNRKTVVSVFVLLALIALLPAPPCLASLENCTLLIIRHAEKPDSGVGLSAAGATRAERYVTYFHPFMDRGKAIEPDFIVWTENSANSHRPELTVAPLEKSLKLPSKSDVADKDYPALVKWLVEEKHGKNGLICWHHGKIPDLVKALGGHKKKLFGETADWPDDTFNWVIELKFDSRGQLQSEKKIVEPF